MRLRLHAIVLTFILVFALAASGGRAQLIGEGMLGSAGCSASAAFLSRVSSNGLDAKHVGGYKTLICGLVSDGIWSSLDAFYIFATKDSTTALTNLISSSFTATTANGGTPLTFTADRGYNNPGTGSNASYIDTNYNASTQGTNFTQNSNCHGAWSNNSSTTTDSSTLEGNQQGPSSGGNTIFPYATAVNGVQYNNSGEAITTTNSQNRQGFFVGNRSGSGADQGYKNGSSIITGTGTSSATVNRTFHVLHANTGANYDNIDQVSAAVFGGSLSGSLHTKLYNRLRTYMTLVGVP